MITSNALLLLLLLNLKEERDACFEPFGRRQAVSKKRDFKKSGPLIFCHFSKIKNNLFSKCKSEFSVFT